MVFAHMRTLIILLCLITFSASAEQVYKQVGEDGVPTFSDQALPGAEKVKIEEPVTFTDDVVHQAMDAARKRKNNRKKRRETSLTLSKSLTQPTTPQFGTTLAT